MTDPGENTVTRTLIVDNTNARAWEISPYVQLANAYGHAHCIVYIPCEPEAAYKRCIHKVPFSKILQMHATMQTEHLPVTWHLELGTEEGGILTC
jgi:hypothetical protein